MLKYNTTGMNLTSQDDRSHYFCLTLNIKYNKKWDLNKASQKTLLKCEISGLMNRKCH